MSKENLGKLVSKSAVEIYNKNIDYIVENHSKELEEAIKNNEEDNLGVLLRETLTSYLITSIELSTLNTIKVLRTLGAEIPDEVLEASEDHD